METGKSITFFYSVYCKSDLGEMIGVEPLDGCVAGLVDLLPVLRADLVLELLVLDGRLHVEAVGLQPVLRRHALLLFLVFRLQRIVFLLKGQCPKILIWVPLNGIRYFIFVLGFVLTLVKCPVIFLEGDNVTDKSKTGNKFFCSGGHLLLLVFRLQGIVLF